MTVMSNYTRFVELSKRFLWVLVAVMVGVVVWIASYNTGENGARIVFSNIPKSGVLQNIMSKPHYQGIDVRGRPYTVAADKAAGIDVFYEGGYEFRTDHAHVDIQKGSAYGDAAIEGQGNLGTLQADGFSMGTHGETIHFTGSVKMMLYRK